MNTLFLASVLEDNVHQAVVQLGLLNALGPDGFPGVFYQNFWPIVKDIVSGTASGFLNGNDQAKTLKRTHITLIPKVLDL